MDPQMDHFGTLNQATKMDPFFDVSKSANVRKWGVPKVKQSRTRMQCSDPGWEMRVPKNGPQNGPQFRYTKPMKNIGIVDKTDPSLKILHLKMDPCLDPKTDRFRDLRTLPKM